MKCPNCDNEIKEDQGRFCDNCGLSIYRYVKKEKESEEIELVYCRICGIRSKPPRCNECGSLISPSKEE